MRRDFSTYATIVLRLKRLLPDTGNHSRYLTGMLTISAQSRSAFCKSASSAASCRRSIAPKRQTGYNGVR